MSCLDTAEGWNELVKENHSLILRKRGIKPTEENLQKFQEEAKQLVKELEAKYPSKPVLRVKILAAAATAGQEKENILITSITQI